MKNVLAAKQKIQQLLEKADNDAQTQVTERWRLDSKVIRSCQKIYDRLLWYFLRRFYLLAFTDGNIGQFSIQKIYPYISNALVTVYGAYFVGRTWEKVKEMAEDS